MMVNGSGRGCVGAVLFGAPRNLLGSADVAALPAHGSPVSRPRLSTLQHDLPPSISHRLVQRSSPRVFPHSRLCPPSHLAPPSTIPVSRQSYRFRPLPRPHPSPPHYTFTIQALPSPGLKPPSITTNIPRVSPLVLHELESVTPQLCCSPSANIHSRAICLSGRLPVVFLRHRSSALFISPPSLPPHPHPHPTSKPHPTS